MIHNRNDYEILNAVHIIFYANWIEGILRNVSTHFSIALTILFLFLQNRNCMTINV